MYRVLQIRTENTTAETLEKYLNEVYETHGLRLVCIDQNGYYIFEERPNTASRPTVPSVPAADAPGTTRGAGED